MFYLHIFSVTICCSQLNIQLVIDDKQNYFIYFFKICMAHAKPPGPNVKMIKLVALINNIFTKKKSVFKIYFIQSTLAHNIKKEHTLILSFKILVWEKYSVIARAFLCIWFVVVISTSSG